MPGQVDVSQCPVGYQDSIGIEVNVSTHVTSTICYAPRSAAELLSQQQDQDFFARVRAATDAAAVASAAWNAANPGQQKCIQWGPIVHANGVSTSSGGVCANVVDSPPTPGVSTPSLVDNTVITPQPVASDGKPYIVTLPGQHAVTDCPSGYQGANGINVNATTGEVVTECWMPAAWSAYRIGGSIWQQYLASGGAVDVAAEQERLDALAELKVRARAVAQAAADLNPGTKYCTDWSGYGETGNECAYAFLAPSPSPTALPSAPQPAPTATPQVSTDPFTSAVKVVAKLTNLSLASKAKTLALPTSTGATIRYQSLTPKVCVVKANKVTKLANGTCKVSATVTDKSGIVFSATKKIVFKSGS